MSYTQYNFKRDFFYEAENAIENSCITFITGPKKCGKTVCLRQLADAYENALYINMKYDFDTDEKRMMS
ncbi:MAG: AAA family ATPase [[Eubacterium] siraeum]